MPQPIRAFAALSEDLSSVAAPTSLINIHCPVLGGHMPSNSHEHQALVTYICEAKHSYIENIKEINLKIGNFMTN